MAHAFFEEDSPIFAVTANRDDLETKRAAKILEGFLNSDKGLCKRITSQASAQLMHLINKTIVHPDA